ncbi:cuticle protein CP14.6-like [Artemia franciscana]|uniref:cuticle protein CP14.6-like n=1 Tax=Artemia franciscana TaxID=6661 RepID=UPI0032DB1F2B
MNAIVLCLGFIAVISAAPLEEKEASVVREEFDADPESGSYKYAVETSNGIRMEQTGSQIQVGEDQGAAAQGSYSYTGPDGQVITLTYRADENGFQPQGDHLPVAPPMPDYVVQLLADLAKAQRA